MARKSGRGRRRCLHAAAAVLVALPAAVVLEQYVELRWQTEEYTLTTTAGFNDGLSPEGADTLRVVFLNTHLLPRRIARIAGNRSDGPYRAEQIAIELSDFDIIAFCETFDPTCTRLLVDTIQSQSGNAFHVISSPLPPPGYLLSGGCLLLSKYPIESMESITFSDASTLWSHGVFADGFVAKGAILARIRLPRSAHSQSQLNCIVTHLEARSPDCRSRQIDTLAEFLRKNVEDVPTILVGDLNISVRDVEAYEAMRRALSPETGRLSDAWEEVGGSTGGTSDPLSEDGGERIDYILYAAGRGARRIGVSEMNVRQLRDTTVGSLSDHAAIEATFKLIRHKSER